jgi:hypothetical protein
MQPFGGCRARIDRMVDGPNQLWVADITYIAIATGFVVSGVFPARSSPPPDLPF